jgi:hypothetical protein
MIIDDNPVDGTTVVAETQIAWFKLPGSAVKLFSSGGTVVITGGGTETTKGVILGNGNSSPGCNKHGSPASVCVTGYKPV